MQRTVVVRNGIVIDPQAITPTRRADVVIRDGRIELIGEPGCAVPTGAEVIDADGLHVLPGAVDPHVHFDEPGRTEWEGFDHGSAAAAAGGTTTIIDMPIDSDPPTLTAADVRAKTDAALRSSRIDVALWGGLTNSSAGNLVELAEAGVVGFKAFACPSGWDDFPAVDEDALRRGFEVASRYDIPVGLHCELESLGHTVESEVEAVMWASRIAAEHDARLHVVHASAAAAVIAAKRYGNATVETCPHYLALDADAAASIGPDALCAPPIRSAANRDDLWKLIRTGQIDCIASDHSPTLPELKEGPAPWAGVSGVETVRSSLFAEAPSFGISVESIVRLTTAAARLFGLCHKGRVAAGYDGDLVLVDLDATFELRRADLQCRHQRSPFIGRTLRGRTIRTLVRGRTVYDIDHGVVDAGGGQIVLRHP